MTTESHQESLVWNASSQNLRVGHDGALLRPAESVWTVITPEASAHVGSGKLVVVDTRSVSHTPRPEDDGSKKKKKSVQVEDAPVEEAPVEQPVVVAEEVVAQETTEDSIVPEESI